MPEKLRLPAIINWFWEHIVDKDIETVRFKVILYFIWLLMAMASDTAVSTRLCSTCAGLTWVRSITQPFLGCAAIACMPTLPSLNWFWYT